MLCGVSGMFVRMRSHSCSQGSLSGWWDNDVWQALNGNKRIEADVLLFIHLIPKLEHIQFPIGFVSVSFAFSHSVILLRCKAIVSILCLRSYHAIASGIFFPLFSFFFIYFSFPFSFLRCHIRFPFSSPLSCLTIQSSIHTHNTANTRYR